MNSPGEAMLEIKGQGSLVVQMLKGAISLLQCEFVGFTC